MPPAAKRDVGVVFFDLYSKENLLGSLLKFVGWETVNTKDEHRLFLVNSQETSNAKNLPNVELVPQTLQQLGVKGVQNCVQQAEQTEEDMFDLYALDLHNVLSLGVYHLREFLDVPGVITKQLILFSNLANFSPMEEELFEKLVKKIRDYDISLYIVGPQVRFLEPVYATEYFFIEKYAENIVLEKPTAGLEQAKKLVVEVSGVIADATAGLHLLLTCRQTAGSQPWKVPLTIGSNIEIPVRTSKVYRRDVHISVKKEKITDGPPVEEEFTLASDVSVKVDVQETVRGLSIHNKFVEVRNDNEIFQMATEPTFDVICFTYEDNVPVPYMIGEEGFVVLPNETSSASQRQFFNALVDCLSEQHKYAIVSRVYIRNTQPKFFVLIPDADQVPKRFMMVEVCTGDGVRHPVQFRRPDKPKAEVDKEMRDFLKDMDATNPEGTKKVALEPTMMMAWRDEKVLDLILEEECGVGD
ncbi:unnamed protein product [Callosobruchus maculatus]|uniref:Ku domain-containing protein n=2 Tax=Callosobruchus maculatus TaxID=64391 RepID=A0A653CNA8_CALMS|nr:unnamed protein product [Callosobruchus maculatus]